MTKMYSRTSMSACASWSSRVNGRSMTFSGGLCSLTRATGGVTATSTRIVEIVPTIGVADAKRLTASRYLTYVMCTYTTASTSTPVQTFHAEHYALNINRRLAWLDDRRQWIARAFFFLDPLLLVAKNVEQQLFIFH